MGAEQLRGLAGAARVVLQHEGGLLQLAVPGGYVEIQHQQDARLRVTLRLGAITRCEHFYMLHQLAEALQAFFGFLLQSP